MSRQLLRPFQRSIHRSPALNITAPVPLRLHFGPRKEMFGEDVAAIAPLMMIVAGGGLLLVTTGLHTLYASPDVMISKRKRGSLIHDDHTQAVKALRNPVHSVSRTNLTNDPYKAQIFGRLNRAGEGERSHLNMDAVEKL